MGETHPSKRWKARPVAATSLRVLILFVPAAAAVGVTILVRPLVPFPETLLPRVGWWIGFLGLGGITAMLVERAGRRLLPLVMMLKLSMLFPDRAPSRYTVAREAGNVRKLKARLAELGDEAEAGPEAWSAQRILALAIALQSHDRQTRGHSERVRVFTDLLADEMRIPAEDRDRLRWAALLHDIGKLTVDAAILNKPGKLDDHEWDVIKRHPAEGIRIAGPLLEWLGPWAGAIAEHHERFDGKGYPAGIAEDHISLAGRMVATADAFDTMTAARSYKKPMAVVAARAELARCAGGQFDPTVVRAFLSISLPVLLWKTGPLAFLMQLPFLARLQALAQQAVAAATQGLAAATVAAGVTATAIAPAASVSPLPVKSPVTVSVTSAAPGSGVLPSPSTAGPGRTEPGTGGTPAPSPSPLPDASARPSPLPSDQPLPSPTDPPPVPLPSVSLLPLPLPTISVSPLPLPLPTIDVSPLPLPSISIPPLPLPSLPGLEPLKEADDLNRD
jgi:putative nucleotidyltransferase with HDIG domain